ncbi:MAG: IS21-like element helper ATPase IstB [Planctomycetota bacterium]|jgi:DNA replication protein DnaC
MTTALQSKLQTLNLTWIRQNLDEEVAEAIRKKRQPNELLERLVDGELAARRDRSIERRLRHAKLPSQPTLATYDFHHPKRINADQVRHLFSLQFMRNASNVVFIGGGGLGKTHLASALAVAVCEKQRNALFTSAAAMINDLAEARQDGGFLKTMKRYVRPDLLVLDELGYLPVDKLGAELLFQVLAARYENASTVITTNRPYKDWAKTFAEDKAMTAAVLDRVVHHCETVIIEGTSYRLKGRIDQ